MPYMVSYVKDGKPLCDLSNARSEQDAIDRLKTREPSATDVKAEKVNSPEEFYSRLEVNS